MEWDVPMIVNFKVLRPTGSEQEERHKVQNARCRMCSMQDKEDVRTFLEALKSWLGWHHSSDRTYEKDDRFCTFGEVQVGGA